jgi:tRNA(adenine34) deaminase
MRIALSEAEAALRNGEVPIGAIVVCNNKIIAKGFNQTELLNDVTAHAEMIALTAAENYLGAKYLLNCTLYVTLEPCLMCAGAIAWAQIPNIVFGVNDPKKGFSTYSDKIFNKKINIISGILHNDCAKIITDFFKNKREKYL